MFVSYLSGHRQRQKKGLMSLTDQTKPNHHHHSPPKRNHTCRKKQNKHPQRNKWNDRRLVRSAHLLGNVITWTLPPDEIKQTNGKKKAITLTQYVRTWRNEHLIRFIFCKIKISNIFSCTLLGRNAKSSKGASFPIL